MIVVLMGVSGSGKSTIGRLLAAELGWTFIEADAYHPPANVEKMRGGTPLTDDDRRPWLAALRAEIAAACRRGENVVLACSALKHKYQDYLEQDDPPCVVYVHLEGAPDLIARRLAARPGHYMGPALLASQFEILQPPPDAVRIDISQRPEEIVADIRQRLNL